MQIDALLWILLPVFIAAGSALLSFYIMQARMEVAISKEREVIAEARAEVRLQKNTMEERVRATEQEARRRALDEFMQDFRVEERHYFRENKSHCGAAEVDDSAGAPVLPQHPVVQLGGARNGGGRRHGGCPAHRPKACSIFSTKSLSDDSKAAVSRLLEQAAASSGTAQLATALNNGHAA